MIYYLNESEQNRIKTWLSQIEELYHEADASRLNDVLTKALTIGYFDEDAIYELLKLLPRIIPEETNKIDEVLETNNTDWQGYMDEQRSRYKREMNKLHQSLSSWIFLQSAVYWKNMRPSGKPLDKIQAKGNESGIKKLR